MTTNQETSLREICAALASKWYAQAEQINDRYTVLSDDMAERDTFQLCASQLEAALAAVAPASMVRGQHVIEELLTNIKRTCIRGRNVADMKVEKNFVATCDHIEDLADQALGILAPTPPATAGEEGPKRCDLGMGCDEAGVCFASAHGQPDRRARRASGEVDAFWTQAYAEVAATPLSQIRDKYDTGDLYQATKRRADELRLAARAPASRGEVAEAAYRWWLSHRPLVFNEAEHLANPGINTRSDTEKALAKAVADALAARSEPQVGERALVPKEPDPFKRIPGLHGISDAADYFARNPADEYAKRRLRERLDAFAAMHGLAAAPSPEARPEAQGEAVFRVARAALVSIAMGESHVQTIADNALAAIRRLTHQEPAR